MMDPQKITALRALLAAGTPGPWFKGHNPIHREPLSYIAEAYSYGPPGIVHLVCVPFEDKPIDEEAKFTAITGNGPTSQANAALITAAVNALPELLDEVERLRAVNKAFRMELRMAKVETARLRALVEEACERGSRLAEHVSDQWLIADAGDADRIDAIRAEAKGAE